MRGKDVKEIWTKEGLNMSTKPFWYSRRFVGAVLLAVSAILATVFGVKISQEDVKTTTDALMTLGQTVGVLWGLFLGVRGQVNKSLKIGIKKK